MFPDKEDFMVHQVLTHYKQFFVMIVAFAYERALCLGFGPSLVTFCQETMRFDYN